MSTDLQTSHTPLRRTERERQTRYLAQSIRLSEAESPGIVKETIYTISFATLAFLAWTAIANISEIARAPGEVIPAGQTRVVQHQDGGTITEIFVKDGQTVTAGTPLLQLDQADLTRDLSRAQARQRTLALKEERLRSLIEGRPARFAQDTAQTSDQQAFLDSERQSRQEEEGIIDDQIRQKRAVIQTLRSETAAAAANVQLLGGLLQSREKLNREGVLADVRLLETRQRMNEAKSLHATQKGQLSVEESALAELQSRKEALRAGWHGDNHRELEGVLAEQAENAELIGKLQNKLARTKVTAPIDGTVQGLSVQMRGSVIQPGQPMMEIVPDNGPLMVSLKIPPRDIGHVSPGQSVQVKVSSFDFSRHGAVTGQLQSLSPSTFQGDNGERYYEGMVTLETPYVGRPVNRVLPGMTVMADIVTGEKSILAYLTKPLQSAFASAFTER